MFSVTIMIETPRHAVGKYFFDEKTKSFRLKKMLPLGMSFPYDFGMIRQTIAGDGDPLDAMVITECDTYPGVEMECRTIGALLATQKTAGKKNRSLTLQFVFTKSFTRKKKEQWLQRK